MKKTVILAMAIFAIPLSMLAQDDDMYYVPSKKKVAESTITTIDSHDAQYSGSNRSVDEYNRRGFSSYEIIDSTDTIAMQGDFELTRNMARWDGYTPTDAYWEGYDRGRSDGWSINVWHSPWYYSSYYPWYYDGWYYDRWYYDPWYPSWTWHSSLYYDPWYYRPYHWGWGGYYHPGHHGYVARHNTVYNHRSRSNGGYGRISAPRNNSVAGNRSLQSGGNYRTGAGNVGNRTSGGRISRPSRTNMTPTRNYSTGGNRSAGNRSSSSASSYNRSSGSSSGNRSYGGSSSSIGGNRSGGSFGGGRSSGGSVGSSRGGGRR